MIHDFCVCLAVLFEPFAMLSQVFGMIASSESFTAFIKHVGPQTVVVPDTCATFFQLITFDTGVLLPPDLIVSQKVASVRALNFDRAAKACSGVGVLELYTDGSKPGGALEWAKEGAQSHRSRFGVNSDCQVHALGCFLYLGHGDRTEEERSARPGEGPLGQRRSHRMAPMRRAVESLPWSVEKVNRVILPNGEASTPVANRLEFAPRLHSMTTDKRDSSQARTGEKAWRNPMLLLPEALNVLRGDEVLVECDVGRLGEKGPLYKVRFSHYRDGALIGEPMSDEYSQKDLFPWTQQKKA